MTLLSGAAIGAGLTILVLFVAYLSARRQALEDDYRSENISPDQIPH